MDQKGFTKSQMSFILCLRQVKRRRKDEGRQRIDHHLIMEFHVAYQEPKEHGKTAHPHLEKDKQGKDKYENKDWETMMDGDGKKPMGYLRAPHGRLTITEDASMVDLNGLALQVVKAGIERWTRIIFIVLFRWQSFLAQALGNLRIVFQKRFSPNANYPI